MKIKICIVSIFSVSLISIGLFSANVFAASNESLNIENNYKLVGSQSLQDVHFNFIVFDKHLFLPINSAALATVLNFSGYSTSNPRFIEVPAYIANSSSNQYANWSIKIFTRKYQTKSLCNVEDLKAEFYNDVNELKDVTTISYVENTLKFEQTNSKTLVIDSNMLRNMLRLGK